MVFILIKWIEVDKINLIMLRSLNQPVAKINVIYIGENEAKWANSDVIKALEAQVLLAKGCCVILIANL